MIMRSDPTDFEFVLRACDGAEVIYSCLNGPAKEWKTQFPPVIDNLIEVAEATGAKLVHWDLAHMYGPTREPITEATPNSAKTEPARTLIKIADKIINATWSGKIDGVIGRSSDVYGHGAISPEFGSSFGGRVFWSALEDTDLSVVGDIDAPRSMSFIDDVACGLIMLGEAPDSGGHVWHLPSAPPISPNELASMVIAQARSVGEVGSSARSWVCASAAQDSAGRHQRGSAQTAHVRSHVRPRPLEFHFGVWRERYEPRRCYPPDARMVHRSPTTCWRSDRGTCV